MPPMPWWSAPALQGLLPALLVYAGLRLRDDVPPALALVAAGASALLAAALGVGARRRERRCLAEDLGPATEEELRRAEQVVRGAVPRDDRERELASWLARHRSAPSAGVRGLTAGGLLLLTVMAAVQAVQHSAWWWVAVVPLAAAAASAVRGDPFLRRRSEELRAPVG